MLENTKQFITLIKNILDNKVKSILEIQCGDGYDIENCKALQDKNLNYIGVDVDDEVIKDNRQYFRNEKNKIFIALDASNEPLPKVDLVVCSGMAQYLPIPNIWSLLENIRDSQAKYVAFDYYISEINGLKINEDIKIENHDDNSTSENKNKKKDDKKIENNKPIKRAINLTKSPFYFPEPNCLVPTVNNNHFIALYKIEDISFFMDWHNDDISLLRSKLFNYLENDFNEIKTIFTKYENGEQMLKSALTADNIDWNKFYYNEEYKKIIDNNNIFVKYIDLLILIYKSDTIERLKADMPERYNDLLTEDNYLWANVITVDFIKWKYNELF